MPTASVVTNIKIASQYFKDGLCNTSNFQRFLCKYLNTLAVNHINRSGAVSVLFVHKVTDYCFVA